MPLADASLAGCPGVPAGSALANVEPAAGGAVATGVFVDPSSVMQFDNNCDIASVSKAILQIEASVFMQHPPSAELALRYYPSTTEPLRPAGPC